MNKYTKNHGWENEDTFLVTLYCLSDLYKYFSEEGCVPDIPTVKSIVLEEMFKAENDPINRLNDVKLINVNFAEIVQCITEDLYWRENSLNSLC